MTDTLVVKPNLASLKGCVAMDCVLEAVGVKQL